MQQINRLLQLITLDDSVFAIVITAAEQVMFSLFSPASVCWQDYSRSRSLEVKRSKSFFANASDQNCRRNSPQKNEN